jgi:hypothetical protein
VWFFCRRRTHDEPKTTVEEVEEQPVKYYQEYMQRKPLYKMEHRGDPNSIKLGESHAELDSSDVCLVSDDARQHELPGYMVP